MSNFNQKYGPWAIVTGASSGLGRQFAWQLAERGMHLVLVARRESVLQQLASQLRARHAIETRVVAADLSRPDGIEAVNRMSDQHEVGLLINNAGMEQAGSFFRYDGRQLRRLVDLNVAAPIALTRHAGRHMVSRGRGGILFVGSVMGYQGVPWYANYAASKAALIHLGESLHYELKPWGVDVLVLSPGVTRTPMAERLDTETSFARIGLRSLTPQYVVRTGLGNLGRRPAVIPGLQYKLIGFLTKWLLPRSTSAWMFGKAMRRAFRNDRITAVPVDDADPAIRPKS